MFDTNLVVYCVWVKQVARIIEDSFKAQSIASISDQGIILYFGSPLMFNENLVINGFLSLNDLRNIKRGTMQFLTEP